MPKKRKTSSYNLRYLGDALKASRLGFGIRATSRQEAINCRKQGKVIHPRGEPIYMWQAPYRFSVKSNREIIRQLRATLLASVSITANRREILNWRDWKSPKDYPCIIVFGKNPAFRGGYDSARPTDYHSRITSGTFRELKGFPKMAHSQILGQHIRGVVYPTKKEMAQIEKEVVEKYGQLDNIAFYDAYRKLIVNKTARRLAEIYRKELERAEQRRANLA